MRLISLARRYAGALFEAAKDADIIDKVESDLGMMTYSLNAVPRLSEALSHPLIPSVKKKEIAREIFEGNVDTITLDFLCLLIDKHREEVLTDIETEYIQIADSWRGIVKAVVTSAVALTDDEQHRIQSKIAAQTGKTVALEIHQDPSLIGGVIVKIGDTIIDGSIKSYLAALRDQLLGKE